VHRDAKIGLTNKKLKVKGSRKLGDEIASLFM